MDKFKRELKCMRLKEIVSHRLKIKIIQNEKDNLKCKIMRNERDKGVSKKYKFFVVIFNKK